MNQLICLTFTYFHQFDQISFTPAAFSLGAPDGHQKCYSKTGNDSTKLLLSCSWPGGYPAPMLHWTEVLGDQTANKPVLNVSENADTLEVVLNRTLLYDGQTLKCYSDYQPLHLKADPCSITLCKYFANFSWQRDFLEASLGNRCACSFLLKALIKSVHLESEVI